MPAKRKYFDDYYLTRLVQEESSITDDRWYIFEAEKPGETAWVGPTQADGEAWAAKNGVRIDLVVPNRVETTAGLYREMCRRALVEKDEAFATRRAEENRRKDDEDARR